MKRIPNLGEWMIGLSFAGLLVLGGVLLVRALEPSPVRFESIVVTNEPRPGELLIVEANVDRKDKPGCTTGVQVDSRDMNEVETRLPVPTRQVRGNFTRYAIVIPPVTQPGNYGLRVRESVYCEGRPRISETPWMAFEVAR